jgi:RND family efflux transporter MFP subunit
MRTALAVLCSTVIATGLAAAPPEVAVVKPVEREISDFEDFAGHADANRTVEIRPRVTSYLSKVAFKEGSEVKKGDLLIELDNRLQKAEVDKAEANLALAKATANLAETDLRRVLQAEKAGVVSKEEVEKARASVEAANAGLVVAKATLDVARLNLAYTRIVSPIDGRIGRLYLTEGNIVKMDETSLTTISSTDPMRIYFDVDERTFLRVRRLLDDKRDATLPLSIQLPADEDPEPRREARVDFVDSTVDPKTGTVRLRATIANPKGALVPGLFVKVRLATSGPRKALLIPAAAVFGTRDGKPVVAVVDAENKVELRTVQFGLQVDGYREVTGGLKAGETVVANPAEGEPLSSGLEVKPVAKKDLPGPKRGDVVPRAAKPRPLPELPTTGPAIVVATVYPGADAQTVEEAVARPIEAELAGVEGATRQFLSCSDDGEMRLVISFKKGTDLNAAQVMVRNRVDLALPKLPGAVMQRGVTVKKKPVFLCSVAILSPGGKYDRTYLGAYAEKQLRDEFARVAGVADVQFYGDGSPSPQIRLTIDRRRLEALSLTAADVVNALRTQNLSVGGGTDDKYTLTSTGRILDPETLRDIVLKVRDSGVTTRLKDVASFELAAGDATPMKLDGKPCVMLLLARGYEDDAAETVQRVTKQLTELRKAMPEGLECRLLED